MRGARLESPPHVHISPLCRRARGRGGPGGGGARRGAVVLVQIKRKCHRQSGLCRSHETTTSANRTFSRGARANLRTPACYFHRPWVINYSISRRGLTDLFFRGEGFTEDVTRLPIDGHFKGTSECLCP